MGIHQPLIIPHLYYQDRLKVRRRARIHRTVIIPQLYRQASLKEMRPVRVVMRVWKLYSQRILMVQVHHSEVKHPKMVACRRKMLYQT